MLDFLKNHPVPITAYFRFSAVMAFAVPKELVAGLIPECLELDTFQDTYGFLAAAFVQTERLRPKGLPQFLGRNFFLVGYRIFVRYTNSQGKRSRGLYIIRSETDSRSMALGGNLFSHYSYRRIPISFVETDEILSVRSSATGLKAVFGKRGDNIPLPAGSPFRSWKEARRFEGPMPYTFSYNPNKNEVCIVEGVRQNWRPLPISVNEYKIPILKELSLDKEARLANAFIINDIPYYWKKGRTEKWKSDDRFRA